MPPPQPSNPTTGFGGAGSLGAALQVGDDASSSSPDHPQALSLPLASKEQASELVQQVEQGMVQ